MLSRSILVLLSLATVTRSEHYHIVPVDSTDLCHDYRNGTCFTLEQLVQTDLLSCGVNLTLSFLPGDHVLTQQLLIRNFSHVQITGQNTNRSITVVGFHSNSTILFVSIIELSIENLGFVQANFGPQNFDQSVIIIDSAHDVSIKDCYFMDFVLLNQVETSIVKIANTQTATIESTLFMNNTGHTLHIEADDVYITNSVFTRNDGGAVYIKSNNALINNTEFNYNSAENGGAVKVVSGTVVITWCNFTNNKGSEFGGAIAVVSSSVSISNSELTNNRAYWGGGAIIVGSGSVSISNSELTNNSAHYRGGTIFLGSGSVSISNSKLINNSADYYGGNGGAIYVESGSMSISNSELTNNRAHVGGAIDIVSGSVSISSSELTYNRADLGSSITIFDSGSSVSISNSTLTNNVAKEGGAIDVFQSSTLIINNTDITNNIGSLNISQSNVTFTGMNIVSNNGRPIYAFNSRIEFNGPTTLSNNRGVFGGAISADQSQIYINTEGIIITNNTATYGGGIFMRESILIVKEPIKIYHNTAHQDGGAIYAYSSRVEFQSVPIVGAYGYSLPPNKQSGIAHNIAENGGGIYAVSSTIKLTQSHVNIDSNRANASGGGVYLQQSSKLYLFKENKESKRGNGFYVKLMINKNLAQYGGGIFMADDTQSDTCRRGATEDDATQNIFADCFIQTIKLYGDHYQKMSQNSFNTFMTNNTATRSGADIYGGLLDRCTASQNAEYDTSNGSGLDYINNTIKSSTKLSISSRPVQVIFCKNDYNIISTRKGHTFRISVMAIDQVENPKNATIRSSVITTSGVGRLKEGQAEQKVGHQCTELEYNVFSHDSSAQVELYAEGPCNNLGISKQFINISFELCTCPSGLQPIQSDIECKCDCDPDLQLGYQITNCFEGNGSITLERNNNTWIEVINTTNETGYVVSSCTLDYCVQKPVNISLSNPDEQCAYNRSGVLCGECEPGLSLMLATSNCKKCSNLYLLLLIPFALAGILLVALILVLNITIATGNIHGLIFYTNIVAANRAIFFPSLNNFLTVFVSWVNLDLGIEACFYDGMNSQGKVLLQLIFPAYLFLLMFLIIILSKYFDSFAKLLSNRNPVAALGTLVLLSYSKFLRFIIAALQNRVLEYPDGSTKTVWLYDGNVPYFTPKHIPQFFAAGIILIAGGLFTVLLFFGQWLPRCSKVMKWTKNTKYTGFMDAYHAPFTPKHRYWVGLLLFALIAHNLVVAMAPDTSLPVLSAGCIAIGLISLNNQVHKKQLSNYLETLFLLNLGILSYGTSYVFETHRQQEMLTIISMSIAFILFVTIISYHFHHYVLKKTKIWLEIKNVVKSIKRNLQVGVADIRLRRTNNTREMYDLVINENDEDDFLEAVDDYEQRDTLNPPYTDGAVEEADPDRYITPPIIRPAMRSDQLRLSYMDELAPLTTEDYRRPAPPPTRVNHRPAVTHTEIAPTHNEV
ncbi:uncharacterized protein LOC135336920 [Halichondria panicea]|uniref:uncharacterized protein LOC135336920 n=1 Tax=Halichondria panicea TaxID=6063 RepID=UPI00312B4073